MQFRWFNVLQIVGKMHFKERSGDDVFNVWCSAVRERSEKGLNGGGGMSGLVQVNNITEFHTSL